MVMQLHKFAGLLDQLLNQLTFVSLGFEENKSLKLPGEFFSERFFMRSFGLFFFPLVDLIQ